MADRDGVVLASCAGEGKVVLFDLDNGREVDRKGVGGGEALPAYSPATGHFYVRSDPGRKLATFTGSDRGLVRVREVDVPKAGHCLTADEFGYYWTCDPDRGRMLRFRDSRG
ncbi:MAG: hypothetical protein LC790_03475 [Actinobacteria bacterium]|nr:hypothetical protein [Actinomycetota bacterium]